MNAPVRTMLDRVSMDDSDLARADAYALLAHLLFAPPQAAVLDSLRQMGRADAPDDMSTAWDALCKATPDAGAIADEYAALFISVGKPAVALYGSWYLTGFLMEKPLALLRDDLQRLGLARREGQADPEDHIAGELEVMRHLIMRGDAAWQQCFFQQHLQPWYGDFCTALATAEASVFYRAVARFMQAFLDMERDYFRLQGEGGVK